MKGISLKKTQSSTKNSLLDVRRVHAPRARHELGRFGERQD